MRVFIRAESGPNVGVGHVMRSVTLAVELVSRGHAVRILSETVPEFVKKRITTNGIELVLPTVDASAIFFDEWRSDVLVVDGYGLASWVGKASKASVPCVVIDDNHELPVDGVELVVNQNLHADTVPYPDNGPRLLLGSRYTLIRRELAPILDQANKRETSRVLVAMGGTDPKRLTLPVVKQLSTHDEISHIEVALDADHIDRFDLDQMILAGDGRVLRADGDLTASFGRVGSAVVGGGSTLWELAVLGIPSVAAIVAENQVLGSRTAAARGFTCAVDARRVEPRVSAEALTEELVGILRSADRYQAMSRSASRLFDTEGPSRIADAIEALEPR